MTPDGSAMPAGGHAVQRSTPAAGDLERLEALCDRGRTLEAYRACSAFAPFEQWGDAHALCVAARIASHLAGDELAERLVLRAYRIASSHPEVVYWVGEHRLSHRGPYDAWAFLERAKVGQGPPRALVSVPWVRAMVLLTFRDFDGIDEQLREADGILPSHPFTRVLRIRSLMGQDRYEEATALASEAVAAHPDHPPSIDTRAALFELTGRREDAADLLLAAAARLDNGRLFIHAADIEYELGRHAEALRTLALAEERLPLGGERSARRLAARRADAAYRAGDLPGAIREARRTSSKFYEAIADRLERSTGGASVLMDVPFVRQEHMTCVPATLSSLGRYWRRPVDQLEVADAICFNGTRGHSELVWARDNGWLTREFTVTVAAAKALLDRGVPFTVDTVNATSAHAQAVIGYDERRGTFHIRDPYLPSTVEVLAEEFLAAYAAHGPRGLALVPGDVPSPIDDIELPETTLYAMLDEVEAALERHDRSEASLALERLAREAPGSRLVLLGRRALAAYDANPFAMREALEGLLALYPDEPTFTASVLGAMRSTTAAQVVLERLRGVCSREHVHPIFEEALAVELLDDARNVATSARMLRRVARALGPRPETLSSLARCELRALNHERALELARLSACANPTDDQWSAAYARMALSQGRGEDALRFLRARAARYARRSSLPSITLFEALEAMERTEEAFEVLAAARAARPEDGNLLRFAAEANARYGHFDEAQALLATAEGRVARGQWLRAAARIAQLSGDHQRALEHARALAALEPLSSDAHGMVAGLLGALFGGAKEREYLAQASAAAPENAALLALLVEAMRGEAPDVTEAALRRLVALEPSNAWVRRELALVLAASRKLEEAWTECSVALDMAPHEVAGRTVAARLAELGGDLPRARREYEEAIRLWADTPDAMTALLESAPDTEESMRVLSFLEARAREGSVTGAAVGAWYMGACRHLDRETMTSRLDAMLRDRADLWPAWASVVDHRTRTGDTDGAIEAAAEAVRRFPLVPELRQRQAAALRAARRDDEVVATLDHARAISPANVDVALELASVLDRRGDADRGLAVIDHALRFSPLDERLRLRRADTLWALDRRRDAIELVLSVVAASPTSPAGWSRLSAWSATDGSNVHPIDLVRDLAARRPWDPVLQVRLAELELDTDLHAALAAIDRAVSLDSSLPEAHDLRVRIHAHLGQREAALAACHPRELTGHVPVELRGREAWVLAKFGDLQGAITRMKQVVAERPDYVWGHQELFDWSLSEGDPATARVAADMMVRQRPTLAPSHVYLAEALIASKQEEDALPCLRRAIEIDPSHDFAARRYVELLLSRKERGRAIRAVSRVERHVSRPTATYLRLLLEAERKDKQAADASVRSLLLDPETPERLLHLGWKAYEDRFWVAARGFLRDVVLTRGAPAQLAPLWIRTLSASGRSLDTFDLLRLRLRNPALAAAALEGSFEALGEEKQAVRVLWLLTIGLPLAWRHDGAWGAAGYALSNCGFTLLTVAWQWSYARRSARPWMLLNLAIAMRGAGLLRHASRVNQCALAMEPDHSRGAHLALLGLDAALESRLTEARELLAQVAPERVGEYFARRHRLGTELLEAATADPDSRWRRMEDVWSALGRLFPHRTLGCLSLDYIQARNAARHAARLGGALDDYVKGYWDTLLLLSVGGYATWTILLGEEPARLALLFYALLLKLASMGALRRSP